MAEETTHVRTRKEIKEKLLKKAFKEGRGAEMMLLIQWRLGQIRHEAKQDRELLEEIRNLNEGQPRSVQMLNALALHEGSSTRYVESGETLVHEGTETVQ